MNSTPLRDAALIAQPTLRYLESNTTSSEILRLTRKHYLFNQEATSEYFDSQTQQPLIREVTSYWSEVSPVSWTHPLQDTTPPKKSCSPVLRSTTLERRRNGVTNTVRDTGSLTILPSTQTERKEFFQDNYGVGHPAIIAKGQMSYQSAICI